MLPENAIDDWLGGFVVFWVVAAAIAGGAVCASLVFTARDFASATSEAPLLVAWPVLLGADGALAWAGLFSGIGACWNGYNGLRDKRDASWIVATFAVICIALLVALRYPQANWSLQVDWPLGDQQSERMGWATAVILVPALIAVLGMWFTAALAFDSLDKPKLDSNDIAKYLELRERLQSLLWFDGIVIGAGVLATGTMRKGMVLGKFASPESFPEPLVLAYGAVFTVLLIVSYIPPYILMQRSGDRLVHCLAMGDDIHAWNESRLKLASALNLGVGMQDTLKNALAILAPIVAGLVSIALPGK